jgi:tetratricopeptide (TPR) repeat protein
MAKVALLIGVGEYQSSELENLAAVERDVAAMRDVLVQPEIGGFAVADVTLLLNPEPQQMREVLERLFADRQSEDLLLLYFSGHGVVDDFGNFHLTTALTDQASLKSKAIAAKYVHDLMENSRSRRQVVILDCCFSGAFAKDMKAKGKTVDLQPQLGGEGRAVLTSSSATEYSFEQKEGALSVYTEYMVEGLRTGIADADADGWISVDEWHRFAQAKVRDAAPAMQPCIYAVAEGYKIVVAQAPPPSDPALVYRKEVEQLARHGQGALNPPILLALTAKQRRWGLSIEVAESIHQEVLRPYQEFAANRRTFQAALQQATQGRSRVSPQTWGELQYLQQTLGLSDASIQDLVKSVKVVDPGKSRLGWQSPIGRLWSMRDHWNLQMASGQLVISFLGGSATTLAAIGLIFGIWGKFNPSSQPTPPPMPTSPASDNHEESSGSPQKSSGWGSSMSAEDYFRRGLKKYKDDEPKGAIEDYNQAIKLKSDYSQAYYHRGEAYQSLDEKAKALTDYRQVMDLSTSDDEHKSLARKAIRRLE